jgi:hypothetical protein
VRIFVLTGVVALFLLVPAAAGKAPPPPTETAVVATGRAPCGLAVHRGELWVGVYEAGAVLRLDQSGRVQQRLRVGRFACRLAVDDDAVWVTRDNAGRVVRIDRRSGRRQALRVPRPSTSSEQPARSGVASFETGSVAVFHPRTARLVRVYRVGGHPSGLTSCGGYIWVGHSRSTTWLTRIDPRTGGMRRVDVDVESPRAPSCLHSQLWVTTEHEALRLAPRTGERLAHVPLGGTPGVAAAAPTGTDGNWMIWVTDKELSRIHRIDRATRRVVDTVAAGPGAFALAELVGSMWVTSFAGADVRRYDP